MFLIVSIDVMSNEKGVGLWGLCEVSGDERGACDEGMKGFGD